MIKKGNPKKRSRKNKVKINTKAYAEHRHALKRLWERYQIAYTQEIKGLFINMIRKGQTLRQEKQTNIRVKHVLVYDNQEITLIYDKKRREIVTFLD